MTGKPKYVRGDVVRWRQPGLAPLGRLDFERFFNGDGRMEPPERGCADGAVKAGVVWVVDAGGAFGMREHSYDILEPFEPCDYKHVPQSDVIGRVEDEAERRRIMEAYRACLMAEPAQEKGDEA